MFFGIVIAVALSLFTGAAIDNSSSPVHKAVGKIIHNQ